jgi:hypothetical protein
MAAFISGFDEQNKRISTQQLLQKIYAAWTRVKQNSKSWPPDIMILASP